MPNLERARVDYYEGLSDKLIQFLRRHAHLKQLSVFHFPRLTNQLNELVADMPNLIDVTINFDDYYCTTNSIVSFIENNEQFERVRFEFLQSASLSARVEEMQQRFHDEWTVEGITGIFGTKDILFERPYLKTNK